MNVDKSMLEQLHRILKEKTGTAAQIRTVIPVGGGSINHAYQLQTTAGSFFRKTRPTLPPPFLNVKRRAYNFYIRQALKFPPCLL